MTHGASSPLRRAYAQLSAGESEPLVALMSEDLYWEGVSRGRLWWKRTPSRRGPAEARSVLIGQRESREASGVAAPQIALVDERADRAVVEYRFGDGGRFYQALWLHDDLIVRIRDCRDLAAARKLIG